MSSFTPTSLAALRSTYSSASQSHVFAFWDKLSSSQQSTLFTQLSSIDPHYVNKVSQAALAAAKLELEHPTTDIQPPPEESVGSLIGGSAEEKKRWYDEGLKAIRAGQVGVLLMAGGQGTRLGSSDPKGCYDIGLPSKKSLFQMQAERIRRLEVLGGEGKIVPWYIMTSGPTRGPTEEFFRKHEYFGLKEENVIFFEQGVLPCLTNEGKFFLDTPHSVAVAPDGNGGIYSGLLAPLSPSTPSESVLSDLAARGITYLHAYCVDNCLVSVADPVFIGYCIERKADCGAKVVKKLQASEAVGVVALKGGKFSVVEYSEIPQSLSEQRVGGKQDGDLAFRAANIANHFYTLDFLKSVASFQQHMPFHIANKKIPHVDLRTGEQTKPSKPNGMKLEQFVFDVFPFTQRMAILEVDRRTDFSPLKNAPGTGSDDPETSRRDLLSEMKRWVLEAGAKVEEGVEVEISPLVSYSGEGLAGLKGKIIKKSGVVGALGDFEKLF